MQRSISLIALILIFGCTSNTVSESVDPSLNAPPDSNEMNETLPSVFEITGIVIDTTEQPVAEAMVLQGGRPETTVLTNEDGTFSMMFEKPLHGEPSIVAAKDLRKVNTPSEWQLLVCY